MRADASTQSSLMPIDTTQRMPTMLTIVSVAVTVVLLADFSLGQYNFCLMPPGCRGDECCYPIVYRFPEERCQKAPGCSRPFPLDCCLNSRVVRLPYGYLYGSAVLLDDEYGYRDNGHRYLHTFLGVRYAKAPSREFNLRFKKPFPLELSQEKLDAMHWGPSCPQASRHLARLLNPAVSEDCLNLNVFVVNDTRVAAGRVFYPILVFLHGEEHQGGSARLYPGHVLAQTQVMVVTANYRLGPLGYLSTEDDEARGNYGLWDQLAALQWVRDFGRKFAGDVNKVTLVGFGSAAADVTLHMLRPGDPLFHQVIVMSGSDLMEGGFVRERGEARKYANELGIKTGCYNADSKTLIYCLAQREFSELVGSAESLRIQDRKWYSRPWSPNIDGEFIADFPSILRKNPNLPRFKVVGGITEGDGSYVVEENYAAAKQGNISEREFRSQIYKMVEEDLALDRDATTLDVQFQYLQGSAAINDSARLHRLVRLWTDRKVGTGVDQWLKTQSDRLPLKNFTQMYVFKYRSASDPKCKVLGAYHQSELQYLFGLPYLNDSDWSGVGLQSPGFFYSRLDMNMTDYMLYMWSNFVIAGNATPDIIRNLTWDTYRPNNRTYFLLDLQDEFMYGFELLQDYRIDFYGYWLFYYHYVLRRLPRFTTWYPTPAYLHPLKVSSFSLTALLVLLVVILLILTVILVRKRKQFR